MTYRVERSPKVQAQLATMPRVAQIAFEGLCERLAADPWDCQPAQENNPAGNLRQTVFGDRGQGVALLLIIDRDKRVVVVDSVWLT